MGVRLLWSGDSPYGVAGYLFASGRIHVLRPRMSSTRFRLFEGSENLGQYCCQDGCCDGGLRDDVRTLVSDAKKYGATHVILRTGTRHFYVPSIEGLPVEDVSRHLGVIGDTEYRVLDRRGL